MVTKKKVIKKSSSKKTSTEKLAESLAENNIILQKKLVDSIGATNELIKSTHKLFEQNSEMLKIFKEASKHINDIDVKDESLRPMFRRLDDLLEQNKTIARGLLMLEKYVRDRASSPTR